MLLKLLEIDPVIGIEGTLVEISAGGRLAFLDVSEQLSWVDNMIFVERADTCLLELLLGLSK